MMKKVTNGDIGRRGSKIWHFHGDVILEGTLSALLLSAPSKSSIGNFLLILRNFKKIYFTEHLWQTASVHYM